jgi:hypothetical protein
MRLIDAQFLETPWDGSRQLARYLRREGCVVGRKRIRRLMAKMAMAVRRWSRARCGVAAGGIGRSEQGSGRETRAARPTDG